MPNVESKYKIEELPRGFVVTGDGRKPVQVHLDRFSFKVNGDPFGLFEYYRISNRIARDLMSEWESPKQEGREQPPAWLYNWVTQKTAKAIGKRVHAQWKRLLSTIDPVVLAVHRAIFAATMGRYGPAHVDFINDEGLYRDRWLVSDIVNYRAAAIAAVYVRDLAVKQRRRLVERSPQAQELQKLARSIGVEASIAIDLSKSREVEPLEAMQNWRGLFSYTGEPYTSLNRTLMNLPGGIPHRLACYLADVVLSHPVTNRLEFIFGTTYIEHVIEYRSNHPINANVFFGANAGEIREAMRRVSAFLHTELNPRRARSVRDTVIFLDDYPEPHHGNAIGLADKSIAWHRDEQKKEAERIVAEMGAETNLAKPPIPLPDVPGITFLDTVGAVADEATRMDHCIASYVEYARRGHCFLFHVEHGGERASIEVNPGGRVSQSQGPRNRRNKAAEWGRRVLNRWGAGFPSHFPTEILPAALNEPVDDIPL